MIRLRDVKVWLQDDGDHARGVGCSRIRNHRGSYLISITSRRLASRSFLVQCELGLF